MKEKHHTGLAILVTALLAFGMTFALGVPVSASGDLVDAERNAETTVVDPGDTVNVSIEFDLDDESHLNLVEGFQPPIGELGTDYQLEHESGTEHPEFSAWDDNGGVLLFDDLPEGEYEFSYSVDIDEDVEPGSVYDFDGAVQLADDETPERQEQVESGAQLLSSDGMSGDNYLEVSSVSAGDSEHITNVTAVDPANETLAVDLTFGSSNTSADVLVQNDSDQLVEDTVDGDTDETATASLPFHDLDPAEYSVYVEPSNGGVDIDSTAVHTDLDGVAENVTKNETLETDVAFSGDYNATATVDMSVGTESNTTTLEYHPDEHSGNETVLTAEWTAPDNGTLDVSVETEPAAAHDGVWASVGGSLIGGFLGNTGDTTEMLLLLVALGVLGYFYLDRRE